MKEQQQERLYCLYLSGEQLRTLVYALLWTKSDYENRPAVRIAHWMVPPEFGEPEFVQEALSRLQEAMSK